MAIWNSDGQNRPSSVLDFKILNIDKAKKIADIDIIDVIGSEWRGITAKSFISQLRDLQGMELIRLHINSPGGLVDDGLAMYNAIQQHESRFESIIESQASSMASVVALAADEVKIARTAKMFIHDAHGFAMGDADLMKTFAEVLNEESQNIASVYADKAGGSTDDWRSKMKANKGIGTTYRGKAAVDAGLADSIMPAKRKDSADNKNNRNKSLVGINNISSEEGDEKMREKMIEMLGLSAEATDEDIEKAVKALQESKPAADPKPTPTPASANNETPANESANNAENKEVSELRAKVLELESQNEKNSAANVVDLAIKNGKLVPSQRDSAIAFALADRKGFDAFVNATPEKINFEEVGNNGNAETLMTKYAPDANEIAAAKSMGVEITDEWRTSIARTKAEVAGETVPDSFGKESAKKEAVTV